MKIARHSKIIDLINQYDIETQEELAAKLQEAGFAVTQATVSRDIRELKLMKIAKPDGGSRYTVMGQRDSQNSEKYIRVLKDAFLSMEMAQNILVIKTMVLGDKASLDVHADLALRQVPDVAHGRLHLIARPQVLPNGLGLGRRLYDHQIGLCCHQITSKIEDKKKV